MTPRAALLACEIGARVRRARLAAKQRQWEVADAIDVDGATISAIERGVRLPSVEVLWDIAGSLRLTVADLMPAHDPDAPDYRADFRAGSGGTP